MIEIIELAEKLNNLLNLYRKLNNLVVAIPLNSSYHDLTLHYVIRYTDQLRFHSLLNKIKELENEKEKE